MSRMASRYHETARMELCIPNVIRDENSRHISALLSTETGSERVRGIMDNSLSDPQIEPSRHFVRWFQSLPIYSLPNSMNFSNTAAV